VSGSSSGTASPFTYFTELVKVIKANTEVMIRLERNSRLVTDDFDTGTGFGV